MSEDYLKAFGSGQQPVSDDPDVAQTFAAWCAAAAKADEARRIERAAYLAWVREANRAYPGNIAATPSSPSK